MTPILCALKWYFQNFEISKNDEGVSKIRYTKMHVFSKFEPSPSIPIGDRQVSLFRVVYDWRRWFSVHFISFSTFEKKFISGIVDTSD